MNSKQGFRKAKGDFLPAAAGAAVLVVITMCVTLWSGPAMAASYSRAPSASPSQQAAAQASLSLASLALCIGTVLVALIVLVLTVDYGRRRIARRRTGSGRGGKHAKASGPSASGAIGFEDEYPSWPGPPGPHALHPDHPSWPGGPDPRWAAAEAMLREDGYPGWPDGQAPPWLDAASPIPYDDDEVPVGLGELTLPIRVRSALAPRPARTLIPPSDGGLQEDQGPGQPGGPGADHHRPEP